MSPKGQVPFPSMKPLLILVLAGNLLMQPAGSLKCFICSTQTSNRNCQGMMPCDSTAKFCKTDVISAVGLLTVISKECTSSCEVYFKDFAVGKRNTTCCSADLCNINGANSIRTSYVQVAVAASATFACVYLRCGL